MTATAVSAESETDLADLGGQVVEPPRDQTGTDPRDFTSKLMPYYLYTELENELEVMQLNLFGMYAFAPTFAMTYDIPVWKEIDYSDVSAFQTASGGIPPGSGFGEVPSGGVPFSDLESDGDVSGTGDLNLRFFARNPDKWEWTYDDGNTIGKTKGVSIIPVLETTLPTATEDVLGGEAVILSPGVTIVMDIPGDIPFGLGFFAMMNFYDFDAWKDDGRSSTSRFRGRWFWMQPLAKPGPGLLDGLYTLVEFQPVYDFETDEFSFWIGPEFGKILNPKTTVYVKPGWGVENDQDSDREFTFETGVRIFF
jgi:hypothetical protein